MRLSVHWDFAALAVFNELHLAKAAEVARAVMQSAETGAELELAALGEGEAVGFIHHGFTCTIMDTLGCEHHRDRWASNVKGGPDSAFAAFGTQASTAGVVSSTNSVG